MAIFLLYGINEIGQTVFSQLLHGIDRADLRAVADARLRDWHAVEVWEGPVCLLRMRRTRAN